MAYWSDYFDKPSCVYRLYDIEGRLLYIGMSTNPLGRIPQHRSRKPWGKQIAYYDVAWHPDREAAKDAERRAIHAEDPLHNIVRARIECR